MLKIPIGIYPVDFALKKHMRPKNGFAFAGIVNYILLLSSHKMAVASVNSAYNTMTIIL